jgi:hypothetical protein
MHSHLFITLFYRKPAIEDVPFFVESLMVLSTLLAIYFLYRASGGSRIFLLIISSWLILQSLIAYSGFYTLTNTLPPRFILQVLPALLFIIALFLTNSGKVFIDKLNLEQLTLLHVVRVPVEITLYWLCVYGTVPQLMTFEGRNFDILSGITAPVVWYLVFVRKILPLKLLRIWNIVCLMLLFNIVINAIFSAPFKFQQFGFEQPNVAVLYFPFNWLPCCVVPIVLFSHLASFRLLNNSKQLFATTLI